MKTKILIAIIAVIFLANCSDNNNEDKVEEAINVKIVPIEEVSYAKIIHSSGRLKSAKEVKLAFKTGGIIQKIFVSDGEKIRKGQILAKLNLEEIESQVNQAKVNYEKSLRDFDRVESLYKDSVVTLEQFQNAKSGLDAAESSLNIAKFNLNYSTITSPFNGKVYKRLVEENEMVSPGMPIFMVGAAENQWQIGCGLTDKDIAKIQLGDKAKIKFDNYDQKISAKVSEIAASANPINGLFEIELTLDSQKNNLVSGLIASVDISTSENQTYLKIPIQALVDANENSGYVFVPESNNSKAKKAEVKIVEILGESVLVNSEEKISQVTTDGVEFLRDSSAIKIKN
ncbi:MAG: efflux RND transporter periplasmic adaptor subunit [Ignavibacteriales bacterium]|nr:efflux RND transporter periplasmic adaptor subunit [Ignavibacteriales bacterium]MCB9219407.1 efflux RND transporter periplasmic adaptor subunit [Ignavibacteriales bacterium]